MSNSLTDFFETLLPREITLYVVPGSLILAATLYIVQLRPNKLFNDYISLRDINSPVRLEDYILYGAIWLFTAYFVGLIIRGIKQGFHNVVSYWEQKNPWLKIQCKSRLRSEDTHHSSRELGIQAMYLALQEETMYRREIERYGVLVEAIENISIALVFIVVILFCTDRITEGIILFLLVIFPISAGAHGYKQLQYRRIETIFKALENSR